MGVCYGIINFPFLPTELVLFADGGMAWDSPRCFAVGSEISCVNDDPEIIWSRSGSVNQSSQPVFLPE